MKIDRLRSNASRAALMLSLAAVVTVAPFSLTRDVVPTAKAAVVVRGDMALYRQLMELNGTSRNARLIMTNTRKAVLEAIETERGAALDAADKARFDALADAAFGSLTEQVLNLIASDQSPGFTDDEIRTLIAANTGLAAATYNAAKFKDQEASVADVQSYMVDSVLEIISAFRDSTPLTYPGPITNEPPQVVQAAILLAKDGTEQVVNHFVGSVHRDLIVNEVGKYIEIDTLTEADKTRLTGIVNASVNKLANRILLRSARAYGQALTADQLTTLIAANDNPAQRKLTRMRTEGGDASDAKSAELMTAAATELAAAFGVTVS